MSLLLSSPRLKLERAGEHLKSLHTELAAYTDRRPHRLTTELDSDGWTVVNLEIVEPMPNAIALIAGDAAHCMRSALDHIIYAVSTGSKRSRGYWPISMSEAEYLGPRGQPPCERPGLRDEGLRFAPEPIKAIVDTTQPYLGGDKADTHVLGVISRLDNADKHRLVQSALGVLRDPGTVRAFQEGTDERTLTTEWFGLGILLRLNEKTKILRWRADPPAPPEQMNVQYNPKLGVVFGERGNLQQLIAAREVIYSLVVRIETTVL